MIFKKKVALNNYERQLARAVAHNIFETTGKKPRRKDKFGGWVTMICIVYPTLFLLALVIAMWLRT